VRLVLRRARLREGPDHDVAIQDGTVAAIGPPGSLPEGDASLDLDGRTLLPGLVNAHDTLDTATLPPLGRPPYPNLYDWIEASALESAAHGPAMAVPLSDRLFLGGVRNLLAGVSAVAHHNPDHRSLGRGDFPVRVLRRYDFAHSPGRTPKLRLSYRTTDRRIPWFVRAGAGRDARSAGELLALAEARVLRQNTVIVHGTAFSVEQVRELVAAKAAVVWCPEVDDRLFVAQPAVPALLQLGVPLGLGSGGAEQGGRDLLSALAAARRTGLVSDHDLLDVATGGSAGAARLPVGEFAVGAPADFVVVADPRALLTGERSALQLQMVAGRILVSDTDLVRNLPERFERVTVDGASRSLARPLAIRLRALAARGRCVWRPRWLEGVML
jgi:cytosine/adenosine deaminase-related metal-dependent hydrolase